MLLFQIALMLRHLSPYGKQMWYLANGHLKQPAPMGAMHMQIITEVESQAARNNILQCE